VKGIHALILFGLFLPGAASGQTRDNASFLVRPGMWEWRQETQVAGLPIRETNTECLRDEEAAMTLKGLAYDLDEACTVADVTGGGGAYRFQLICGGDIPGAAAAELTHTMDTMTLSARGKARPFGLPVGFSMSAEARYVGACPAPSSGSGGTTNR